MAFIEVKNLSKVYNIGERTVMANDKFVKDKPLIALEK